MNQAALQSAPGESRAVPGRLEAVGLCGVQVYPSGCVEPFTQANRLERLLLRSLPLERELGRRWEELVEHLGRPLRVWPGLTLLPLRMDRRRRVGGEQDPPVTCAVMLGSEVVTSDQFRNVCDAAGVDAGAVIARADTSRFVAETEIDRWATAVTAMTGDASELEKQERELASLSGELSHSYEELSLLYKLSSGMTVSRQPADFIREACQELQTVSGMRWTALVLVEDEPRLNDLAGKVFHAGAPAVDAATLERTAVALMRELIDADAPRVFDDPRSAGVTDLERLAPSLLVVPLRGEGRRLGMLLAGEKLDGSSITSVDSKLCDSLAGTLAIFLRNTILFADTQSMFLGTLQALTAAIDAKDSYTHGHSERVALLARMLAEAAGLDEETCRRVHLSGLVHDVGKIGVPEAVLSKPGKLTRAEFEQVKRHPEIGARILQDIRQMHDLIPGVLYHHERWDGRGYPHGVAGYGIPLFGRLIGLADAFDAMSSDRTYRSGLDRRTVLDEVVRCRGTQFDPDLADLFARLDFTAFDEMIARHQRRLDTSAASEEAA